MPTECKHKYRPLYYRKTIPGSKTQPWVKVPNHKICEKCLKIVVQKSEVKEIGSE